MKEQRMSPLDKSRSKKEEDVAESELSCPRQAVVNRVQRRRLTFQEKASDGRIESPIMKSSRLQMEEKKSQVND